MSTEFVIMDSANVPNACVLGNRPRLEKPWQFSRGMSRVATFPPDFAWPMDPEFPNATLLVDNLINTDGMLVISPRLHEFFKAQGVDHVEYLPLTILDHRGRPAAKDYVIAHPIDPVDCLDLAASKGRLSEIQKDVVMEVEKVVLEPAKIDPTRQLFRAKGFPVATIVTRKLADAIDAGGFVGIRWIALDKFRG